MSGRTVQLVFLALSALACSGSNTETVIGPAGGIVEAPGVQLIVPPNALRLNTPIRISQLSVGPGTEWDALSAVFEFQPAGTRFDVPATVRFETRRFDERALIVWQSIGSTDPLTPTWEGAWASAAISHFSTGFVAVPASELDASMDAGVDAEPEPDAAPDGEVDAAPYAPDGGLAIPDLECWTDELVPGWEPPDGPARADAVRDLVVGPGGQLAFLDGDDLVERVDGAWTRTNLLDLVDATANFDSAGLTADETGRLHAIVIVERPRGSRFYYANHLVRSAGWSITAVNSDPLPCHNLFSDVPEIQASGDEVNVIIECGLGDGWYDALHCTNRSEAWNCSFLPNIEWHRSFVDTELAVAPDGRFFYLEQRSRFHQFAVWSSSGWSDRHDIGGRCDIPLGCPDAGGGGGSIVFVGADPVFYTQRELPEGTCGPDGCTTNNLLLRSHRIGDTFEYTTIGEPHEWLYSQAVVRGSDEFILIGSRVEDSVRVRLYHHSPAGSRSVVFPYESALLGADRNRLFAVFHSSDGLRVATTCL